MTEAHLHDLSWFEVYVSRTAWPPRKLMSPGPISTPAAVQLKNNTPL